MRRKIFLFLLICGVVNAHDMHQHAGLMTSKQEEKKPVVMKTNEITKINDNYSFIYSFPQKARMGNSVLRIELLNTKNERVNDLEVEASYDMPSMRGHHGGKVSMRVNKTNQLYLDVIPFVMRGQWEIILDFKDNKVSIYKGIVNINI
ncbi:MAG: FixH family protein [Rickettsiales bacterium]|jgi:plasmid maintenance system killer protein|nr:FixH family protein [Rickettsiales bacterium]